MCDTGEGVRQPAHFLGASEDGSKVFFATTQPLLGSDTSVNIYEYDFDASAGERVVRVTGGDGSVSNPAADVGGVAQISPDGSHIYFVAGVLTTNPNYAGEVAQAGAANLYVYERDASYPNGQLTFIATMPASDTAIWGQRSTKSEVSAVTSDGRFLVFAAYAHLTPDDTSGGRQLFEYDSEANRMMRVSIGQDGFDDNGNTVNIGQSSHFTVSSDGSYVFFESEAGLTPQALDYRVIGGNESGGVLYANNVYEYHDGNVYLISDGQDVSAEAGPVEGTAERLVHLLGASVSGRDVFFTTTDRLVGQDTDTQVDIYDARIDGGFPAPATPVECQADACQGPLSAAPVLLSAGSELQAGGEDLAALAGSAPVPTTRALTKAQQLLRALRACGRVTGHGGAKRRSCEAAARRRHASRSNAKARKSDGRGR
jgi:hypothetical protein